MIICVIAIAFASLICYASCVVSADADRRAEQMYERWRKGYKMSDLIRREDAIEAIEELPNAYNGWSDAYDKAYIIGALEEVPSADRPQGEWIEKNNGYDTTCECSVCHYRNFIPNYQVGSKYVCMDRYWFKRNFCPSCGARMKGADDETN